MSLQPGDPLPDFTLPTDGGGTVSAADLSGRKVVIYFYPKDDTSGCTKEAQAFRDAAEAFAAAGVTIIGISPDTVASHDKFKAKHGLTFTLAADEDKAVAQTFGVWVEKSMYGKSYMGVDRSTFLIGPSGRIERIWRKVKVPGHVEEVLAAAKAL
jgi:peroxiredoxin Q/BCP